MRNQVIAAFALFSIISPAWATSIVAVRAPDTIVLAADSKLIRGDRSRSDDVCKIGITENIAWAGAGLLDDSATQFNVRRIVTGGLSLGGTFTFRIKTIQTALEQRLTGVLNALKRGDPGFYASNYENQVVVEMLFALFEQGVPRVSVEIFAAFTDPVSGNVSVKVVHTKETPSSQFPGTKTHYFTLGVHDKMDAQIGLDPAIWSRLGFVGAANHLIQLEIADDPADVGPPIAIVQLDAQGIRWINPGVCR